MRMVAETAHTYGLHSLHFEGGTAISAYFLGHRESEDLDFFADPDFDARGFPALLPSMPGSEFVFEVAGSPTPSHARVLARNAHSGTLIKLDFAASSPFRLAPREPTTELVEVASYRDLCAGKLRAICDRFEVRDFIDLDAILNRPEPDATSPGHADKRERARAMIVDLIESDPGLDPLVIGTAVARGLNQPIAARFPLRLLRPVEETSIQQSISLMLECCVALAKGSYPDLAPGSC